MLARATDSKWGRSPVSPARLRAHWQGWHAWVGWHAWAEGTRVGKGDTRGQGGTVSAATKRQQAAAAGVTGDIPVPPVSPVSPRGSRPRGAHGDAPPLLHPRLLPSVSPPVSPSPRWAQEGPGAPQAPPQPPREGQERWHRGHEEDGEHPGYFGVLAGGAQEGHRRDNPGASRWHCQLPAAAPGVPVPPSAGGCREPWCWQVQHLVEAPPLPARRRHLERPLMSVECPSEQIAIEPSPAPAACLKAAIFSSRVHKRWN